MYSKTFILKSKYINVVPSSKEIKEFISKYICDDSFLYEVEICIMEALNNVITHAYLGKDSSDIEVTASIQENHLELKISDFGISRTTTIKNKLNFNPKDINSLPENGMGLYIINQLMDKTHYSINNKKNTFLMQRRFETKCLT